MASTPFSAYVRSQRQRLGMPGYQVERRGGLAPGSISQYERGIALPSLRSLPRLAEGLQVPLPELLSIALGDERISA